MEITRTCPLCRKETTIEIKGKERIKQMEKYICYGARYIQEGLSLFTSEEREFYKTGYCMECQKLLFGMDEDDEDNSDDYEEYDPCYGCQARDNSYNCKHCPHGDDGCYDSPFDVYTPSELGINVKR